jgi:hypothetical protein
MQAAVGLDVASAHGLCWVVPPGDNRALDPWAPARPHGRPTVSLTRSAHALLPR